MNKASGSSAVMASKRARLADGAPWQKAALFCTPPWATRTLFRVVLPRLGVGPMLPNIVWEPCAGLGHMSKVIEEFATATFASDINDFGAPDVAAGLDACDHSEYWNAFVQGRPDWIITNPPFSPDPPLKSAAEMLPGFLHFARVGVALLCRLQWLETEERHALLSEFPPSLVAIFSERVPMCEGGYDPKCKSASAYAWFIWKRQEDGQWPRCLADGQFTAFLIPPGQKKAWFKPSDLLLAKRHVPGFVPPSARRKEREAGRLSEPMAIVLRNLIEGRSAFWHISGVSEHGGASGTSLALRKRGFVDHDFQITEAGKLALEKWSAR